MNIYAEFVRFLLPLVLTTVVLELGNQFQNGGMARMPDAANTLAAYGLAWGLIGLLTSVMAQVRQLGIVLVDGQRAFRRARTFVLLFSLILSGIIILLALPPLGLWVVEGLHRVSGPLGRTAREALLWLAPLPILQAMLRYHDGLLIRIRRTDVVSYATFANVGISIAAVFVLLKVGFVQQKPILLPLLVTYAGLLSELGVILWGFHRLARRTLQQEGEELSMGYLVRFYWPLALIMAVQGVSRPTINLFVSREPDGPQSLAALTVVYSLALLPYGWVNEIRNLPTPFRNVPNSLRHIRRFALGCGLLSFTIMLIMFWTPLREVLLTRMIGVDDQLALLARAPLMIFTFFPLTVMARAYAHGVAFWLRRTKAIAPSAPARFFAILVALLALPALGVHGAARGVAALLCGFAIEALVVLWGLYGRRDLTIAPEQ